MRGPAAPSPRSGPRRARRRFPASAPAAPRARGLQAPVVTLADACANPDNAGPGGAIAALRLEEGAPAIPAFRPRRDELAEPLKSQIERQDRLDREEHWRLLYVALTRAEERLYVGGALGARRRNGPAE